MSTLQPGTPLGASGRSAAERPELRDKLGAHCRSTLATQTDIVPSPLDYEDLLEPVHFDFTLERREFVQLLGAGFVVSVFTRPLLAQRGDRSGGGAFGGPPTTLAARLHIGADGMVTILSGKVDAGQGARTEIAMAAAEELRLPLDQVQVRLADTAATPNDGITAGSMTTPRTIPPIRHAAAATRQLLVDHAAAKWGLAAEQLTVRDGRVIRPDDPRQVLAYADLARDPAAVKALSAPTPPEAPLTGVAEWQVLGTPQRAATARAKAAGAHQFPSDMKRPDMLYGAVLRPAAYRAKLTSVDLEPARAMKGVLVVRDGDFVGVAAPTSFAARAAIEAIAKTSQWDESPLPPSETIDEFLLAHAEGRQDSLFDTDVQAAAKSLRATYHIAYIQHAPLEPRTTLAEWTDGQLTVWTGTQNPFGVRGELARAFRLADDAVRVVVPDFGSGYGGKHTGESAIEAARLAKETGKPVMLRWTRKEEFTWAYFRPAGVMEMEASLDAANRLATWRHINISSGRNSLETPYTVAKKDERTLRSQPPLREGSYRALASTGNTFARESFMDELAVLAGVAPLEFRLMHLDEPRLRPVLTAAAEKFNWRERASKRESNRGVGLACSWDKGSVVACCVEVEVDRKSSEIHVVDVCEAFECGKILNPDNLRSQIEGAVVMGLGPALSEEIKFDDRGIINSSFRRYRVPHFTDLPKIETVLVDRPDLTSFGAGETPLIAIAPAIANAVFQATGQRIRQMPIRLKG